MTREWPYERFDITTGCTLRITRSADMAGHALVRTEGGATRVPAAALPAVAAALYEAAGLPAPVILERPAIVPGAVTEGGITAGREGRAICVGLPPGPSTRRLDPAGARRLAVRRHITEGHRGEKCFDPECGCSGWQETDPEHSASMGGQPNLPWYACWIRPRDYILTAHVATSRCSDLGCEHERTLINGAQLLVLPLKIQLLSEPGRAVARRTLAPAEALEHAAAAIASAKVKAAHRSPMWDQAVNHQQPLWKAS